MTTFGTLLNGTVDVAGRASAEAAARSDDKEQAAEFRKELTRAALTMASNWVMEGHDLMAEMESDDNDS